MNNPFRYSSDNKRYHTLSFHNKSLGISAYKAVLDAGFTCPNIDGTRGTGGCIFCSGGSGYFTAGSGLAIEEQLKRELERIRRKRPSARAIAYFQAHTNTYAETSRLRELYERALAVEGVCGISIATRCDALGAETLEYLRELNTRTYLTVELGLQTVHNSTAEKINRCHSYLEFLRGFDELKKAGIRICVHLINGLPGEDEDMMVESAAQVGRLRPDAVKLHLLHVLRRTPLEQMYSRGDYTPLTLEDYVNVIVRQLEVLPPETVIERITGDGNAKYLAAPLWSRDKLRVLGSIDKALEEKDTWQGRLYCQREECL